MLKFYNKVVAGVDHAVFYQSAALLLFVFFFLAVIIIVVRKPKSYYKDMSNLPLDLDQETNNDNNKKNTNS